MASQRAPFHLAVLPALVALAGVARGSAGSLDEPGAEAAPGTTSVRSDDLHGIVRELDVWLDLIDTSKELTSRRKRWIDERLMVLGTILEAEPERLHTVAQGLLTLAGFRLTRRPDRSFFVGGGTLAEIRGRGLEALRRIEHGPRGDALHDWLLRGVLSDAQRHPVERRWIALHLLERERGPLFAHVLLAVARDRTDPLRPDALAELPTLSTPAIDEFLVENMTVPHDEEVDPHPFNLIALRMRRGPLDPRAAGALGKTCKGMLLSSDWRDASRALELASSLDPMRTAPMMIEALHTWNGRTDRGSGSRRLVHEIVAELRRISGRAIGNNAQSWTTWWRAVVAGQIPLRAQDDGKPGRRSQAGFFGLEPVSDRVTFIIDHSGSMQAEWGSTGHSRYVEAIEQMLQFLQASGDETRFNIVIFDSEPVVSTTKLVEATPQNLERARTTLLTRTPEGGTNLKSAVEVALGLDANGRIDLDRLEADTVVVLCDGETSSGRDWVAPLLERVNTEARVVFHCALIGTRGDGTLEALARGTRGEFLRIDG